MAKANRLFAQWLRLQRGTHPYSSRVQLLSQTSTKLRLHRGRIAPTVITHGVVTAGNGATDLHIRGRILPCAPLARKMWWPPRNRSLGVVSIFVGADRNFSITASCS